MRLFFLLAALALAVGCSDDDTLPLKDIGAPHVDGKPRQDKGGKPKPDAGATPDKGKISADKGKPDTGLATIKEQEPNDGTPVTAYQSVSWPIQITGTIGKAADQDIFSITAKAGDRFVVRVTPTGPLQPHIVIFDPNNKLPTAANQGTGGTIVEYYMVKDGSLFIALRDLRNVAKPPQNVGGPAFAYTLTITRLNRAAVPVMISVEKSGTLSPAGTVRVFSYTATKGLDMWVTVKAKQLSSPSEVDSRLTLFHPGQKVWLGTNDDSGAGVSDSLLKGPMPFSGTYHAIVENVKLGAKDLRFAFRATTIK